MKVMYYEVGKNGVAIEIEHSLEAMQKLVGGWIEIMTLTPNLALVCNEEGGILELPTNLEFPYSTIYGNAFICRRKGIELCGLTDQDIEFLKGVIRHETYDN